jgi:uncharacterized protein YlxP (DUF503 family)
MHLAAIRLELRIKDCLAVRVKRRRIRAIVEKLHKHFNVSVAEVDRRDHPSESVLAVAVVAETRREARELLGRVADALAVHPRAELLGHVLIEV